MSCCLRCRSLRTRGRRSFPVRCSRRRLCRLAWGRQASSRWRCRLCYRPRRTVAGSHLSRFCDGTSEVVPVVVADEVSVVVTVCVVVLGRGEGHRGGRRNGGAGGEVVVDV